MAEAYSRIKSIKLAQIPAIPGQHSKLPHLPIAVYYKQGFTKQDKYGAMAQLVARLHGMEKVGGSNPPSSTDRIPRSPRNPF